jgi:hypothetical protein
MHPRHSSAAVPPVACAVVHGFAKISTARSAPSARQGASCCSLGVDFRPRLPVRMALAPKGPSRRSQADQPPLEPPIYNQHVANGAQTKRAARQGLQGLGAQGKLLQTRRLLPIVCCCKRMARKAAARPAAFCQSSAPGAAKAWRARHAATSNPTATRST